MKEVCVYFNSTSHHFSQLLSGLEFLKRNQAIQLKYILDKGRYPGNIFKVNLNGLEVFFDLEDSSHINSKIYDKADFYVKRMLLKTDYDKLDKLIPYGLYYPVYYKNTYLKYLFLKDFSLLKYSLKYWPFLSSLLEMKDCISVNGLPSYEPKISHNNLILFRTRLWNPGNNEIEWKKKERTVLNDQRILINRLLSEKFGNSFSGGIMPDEFSMKECPDVILQDNEYHRDKFLKLMENSSIGIVNQGLEDSVGAKFGEYMAHGLAIVTTPINKFQFLGPLEEGKHYLQYENVEECASLTHKLFNNKKIRREMQQANLIYYHQYLHPAKKLQKIFEIVSNKKYLK